MYVVAWAGTALFGMGASFPERLLILAGIGGASLAAYLGAAYLLRVEELRSALVLLRRRKAGAEN